MAMHAHKLGIVVNLNDAASSKQKRKQELNVSNDNTTSCGYKQ